MTGRIVPTASQAPAQGARTSAFVGAVGASFKRKAPAGVSGRWVDERSRGGALAQRRRFARLRRRRSVCVPSGCLTIKGIVELVIRDVGVWAIRRGSRRRRLPGIDSSRAWAKHCAAVKRACRCPLRDSRSVPVRERFAGGSAGWAVQRGAHRNAAVGPSDRLVVDGESEGGHADHPSAADCRWDAFTSVTIVTTLPVDS